MSQEHQNEESARDEQAQGHPMGPRKLYRSSSDRVLGGVCGGLGEYFNIDPLLFRVGWVILTLMGGVGLLAYGAAWIFLPEREGAAKPRASDPERSRKLGLLAGAVLICMGACLLLDQFGWYYFDLFDMFAINFEIVVPLAIIGFGIYLIANRGGVKVRTPALRNADGTRRRLLRSHDDRRVAGVCGGLARYFGIDSTWVRLGAIFLVVFTHFIGVITYIALMIVMPEEPRTDTVDEPHQGAA